MTVTALNTPATNSAAAGSNTTNTTSSSTSSFTNEQTFLQLLVAQIQNQDPMSPTDSTQFVTQLAQFSSLEQLIGIKQDLDTQNASITATNGSSQTNTGAGATTGSGN